MEMGKVIAAINRTIDGVFDHTTVNPDAEIHQHYTDLINCKEFVKTDEIVR